MLSAPTKKTAWEHSTAVVKPGPLPGTEPGANAFGLPRFRPKGFNGFWRVFHLLLVAGLIFAAFSGLLGDPDMVYIGNAKFKVQVASTDQKRINGLSNTNSLAPNTGMLFTFDQDYAWPIWMKDMRYSLDILWLNSDKQVITIKSNVAPSTYPEVFVPDSPARYVLEIPAGAAAAGDIQVGQTAIFNIKP